MVEWGAKPLDAIRTSTVEAARLLNQEGKAGVVKTGAYADIIAVSADPRSHIEELQHVRFVMKAGTVYKDEWEPLLSVQSLQ